MSADGKAILAIRSTAKGEISTIVPALQGPTTTPKKHVDYVVTEWGSTRRLRGKTDGQRAYEVLRVAHPLHRTDLAAQALGMGLITEQQQDKLQRSVFHSIRLSFDPATRGELADAAFKKKLITAAQRREIKADLPLQAAAAH